MSKNPFFLALGGWFVWVLDDLLIRFLTTHYSVFQLVSLASFFGAFFLGLFFFLKDGPKSFSTQNAGLHFWRSALWGLASLIVPLALIYLPLSDFYALGFTDVFGTVLLAMALLKEKPKKQQWLSVFIGLLGVLLILRPEGNAFNLGGALMLLLSLGISPLSWILTKKMKGEETSCALGFYPLLFTGLVTLPFAIGTFQPPSLAHWGVFALSGLCNVTGVVCVSLAYRGAEASKIAPTHYTQLVYGLFFGFFLFAEIPTFLSLTGAFLIVFANLLTLRKEADEKPLTA